MFWNIRKILSIVLTASVLLCLVNTRIYAQESPTLTNAPSPSPVPSEPVSCINSQGWVTGTKAVFQGKQLNGLPVPLSRSDTANAYGPSDELFYSLGRGGWVEYFFPQNINNVVGDDIRIYEVTNGRSTYPLESAKIRVSPDGTSWYSIAKIATSRINILGITSINIGETGLSQIRFIRLQDIISKDNIYPDADGFDVNAIEAVSVDCPPPPTATPTITPTASVTPTETETPTPTITPTETPTPSPTLTPSLTPSPTLSLTPTLTLTPSLSPTPTLTPTPVNLIVDYSTSVSTGSPYVFGGSHSPRPEQTDAWQKMQDVGVTAIRHDFNPDRIIPPNITLDDYRNNVNNVQDPANWSPQQIAFSNGILTEAGNRGMKRIGIMAYIPRWLSTCNCIFGVPSDFTVYKDLTKKVYRLYRDKVEYVEIWNEPTLAGFLNLTGSSLTREQAYIQIFNTAAAAIREVDAEINDGRRAVIGGLVADSPDDTDMLIAMMQDSTLKSNLDFVSYHAYDKITEPSWVKYKPILASGGLPDLPLYITEWNYFFNDNTPSPFNTGPESVSYTGRKFIEYLKMGLPIANYHTLEPINTSRPNNGEGTYGFYRWDATTNTATLTQQSKSWRLLSKTLGLGAGPSTIYGGPVTSSVPVIGFTNSTGGRGAVFSNEQNNSRVVILNTNNISGVTQAKLYQASQTSNGDAVLNTITPNLIWRITVPPLSVTALVFE
jgi:hypothetical protein